MTEQKEKLKSVRDNLETLLTAPRPDMYDPDEIIENCVSILDELLADQQQTYKVGEYYVSANKQTYNLISKSKTNECWLRLLLINSIIVTSYVSEKKLSLDRKATADEIARFKRAEHFHSKGRKLNEFRVGDIVKERNKNGLVIEIREHEEVVVQYPGELLQVVYYKYVHESLGLITTAEELEAETKGEESYGN